MSHPGVCLLPLHGTLQVLFTFSDPDDRAECTFGQFAVSTQLRGGVHVPESHAANWRQLDQLEKGAEQLELAKYTQGEGS